MSDTDDTDDLLLIPPDFFLVHSEPEPPYYSIVDSLIKQVSDLQNRIEGIESISDVSLVGSNLDYIPEMEKNVRMFNSKDPSAKRYYSHDDLYQSASSQSTTPQKLQDRVRLHSLPNTPSVNRFSPRKNSVKFSSPQKSVYQSQQKKLEKPEVLQEIDTFMSNVKTLQRNNAVRNLERDFSTVKNTNIAPDLNKYTGKHSNGQGYSRDIEETMQELNRQSERISGQKSEAEERENALQERVNRVNSWQCGDNIQSVPDYGAGLREYLHNPKETKILPNKQRYLKSSYQTESTTTDFNSTNTTLDKSTDSSSESTQLTAYNKPKNQDCNEFNQKVNQFQNTRKANEQTSHLFKTKPENQISENVDLYKVEQDRDELLRSPLHDNALTVLNMHKQLLENTKATVNDGRTYKQRSINTLSDALGLLSLADIWGSGHLSQSPSKLSQKLQEEKLRRQHCEHLIQDLQNRNLEMQQKLAVALNVDETKNKTIQQFRAALDNISGQMEVLKKEKCTWDKEIARLKNQHSIEIESSNQKCAYYEKEASKSLNLAHANQEKISAVEKKCADLQQELEQIESKFKEVEKNYQREFDKNKQLADIISQKEIELKENKSVLNAAREEVSHSRKAVEVCQTEFTALKDECVRLETALREDKHTILNLNEQKRKLTNDIQTYKQNEKTLRDALEHSKLKLENTKIELRNFYQGQLEIIVENKRKEMQSQLDRERQSNLEEMKKKELSMAKTAANHIKEISDKCALETKLLEQKHQEEIRLYQMQLTQKQKEIDNLQNKLAQLPEKRAQIAKQLQKVMETQWNETLKMINGSPVPVFHDGQNFGNINAFQSRHQWNSVATNQGQEHHHPENMKNNFESVSDYDETPVSSRGAKQSESEIQKYINMLLNRPPGNPITDSQVAKSSQNQQESTWNAGDLENQNRYEASSVRQSSRDRKSGKPPWK